MQCSRTWKVLKKESRFFELAVEKFWIFAWGSARIS